MVVLATLAAIIASQAVITGVFSMTQQAVQLGQLPRMEIRHTSATDYGQIYVPRMNAFLAVGVVLIVLIFKSSGALAAAYGIAVTGVMVIDTFNASHRGRASNGTGASGLVDRPVRRHGHQRSDLLRRQSAQDSAKAAGCRLFIAAGVFIGMDTWRRGRRVHLEKVRSESLPLSLFLERADKSTDARRGPGRVPVVAHRHRARRAAAQSQAQQGAA